jgi:hypothetical protein
LASSKIFLIPRYPSLGKAAVKFVAGITRRVDPSPHLSFGLWSFTRSFRDGIAIDFRDSLIKSYSLFELKISISSSSSVACSCASTSLSLGISFPSLSTCHRNFCLYLFARTSLSCRSVQQLCRPLLLLLQFHGFPLLFHLSYSYYARHKT